MKKLLIIIAVGLILGLIFVKGSQNGFFTIHSMNGVVLAEHDMEDMQATTSEACKANTCIVFAPSSTIQTALLWTSELREFMRIFAFFALTGLFAFVLHQEFSRSGRKKGLSVFSSIRQIMKSVILRE